MTDRHDPAACAAQAPYAESVARSGFCTSLTAYAFTLCRVAGQAPKTLTFATAVEADFSASRDTERVWDWARGAFPPQRHTVTFGDGDCRTWTVRWSGQGSDGWSLTEGFYELGAVAVPTEWVPDQRTAPPPGFMTVEVVS